MRVSKKVVPVLASMLLCFSSFSMPVYAETVEQDGLSVSYTTDKDKYSESDKINATLTVKNNNAGSVFEVELDEAIPDGYKLADGSFKDKSISELKSGESQELKTVFVKNKDNTSNPDTSTIDSTSDNCNNSSQSGGTSSNNSTSDKTDSNPSTGDNMPILAMIALSLASCVVIASLKRGKGKQMLSLFLAISMLGVAIPNVDLKASAARNQIDVALTIDVDGKDILLSAKVIYSSNNKVENTNINFDLDDALYDSETDTYYLFDEKKTLDGTINNSEGIKSISYIITDCNNKELMKGELPPANTFTIENLGLIIGDNNVSVTVNYADNTSDNATVKINNLCEKNMQTLDVDRGDNDSDGVLNFIEDMYHTDPEKADSDEDTLSDYDEMAILGTDPMKADTDDNGTDDASEDFDGDGITNYDELYTYKTDPVCVDSDGDGLSDYDELFTHKTDPNKADTDGDEADDYWEIQNGFDPLTFNDDFGNLDPHGNTAVKKDDGTEITVVLDDAFLDESTPGYMGVNPYYVDLGDNSSTDISIPFNNSSMSEDDVPTLYYYNEETQRLEEVPTTITEDGQAVATIDKSGTYVLLNRRYVSDVWENDIIPPSAASVQQGSMDIVFVIDRSASMDSNDPDGIRKQVVKEFIEKLRPEDRAAIVQFTAVAETIMPITDDKEALINAVDSIENSDGGGCAGSDSNAGTNGGAGLRNALDELNGSTAQHKYIIFLTDGADTTTPELPEGTPEGSTYYNYIENEARGNVIIHTIGLVGTGDVNTDILKEIADATNGNYYLATTGTEAENVPGDVLNLEDVYNDIENITIDRVKDSNEDGISDYYTKLICDGKLVSSKGTLVFGGASYDNVQANADFDGDGLLNGEEVVIMESEAGVYAKVNSYPFKIDSDKDTINDYDEVKLFGTNPMKYNSNVSKSDVEWITNSNNFMSCKYLKIYNSSNFERESVKIGNGFFGSVADQTILYQTVLGEYLEQLDSELLEQRGLKKYDKMLKEAYYALVDQMIEKVNKSISSGVAENDEEFKSILGVLGNLKSVNDMTNAEAIKKSSTAIHNFVVANDLSKAHQETERLRTLIKSIPPVDDDFYNKAISSLYNDLIQNAVSVDRLNFSMKENPFTITKVGLAFDGLSFINFGLTVAEVKSNEAKQYCSLLSNMELLCDNIYVLNTIISTSDNQYLANAAKNLKKYALETMNNNLDLMQIKKDFSGASAQVISMEALHTVLGSELAQYAVSCIPYVGQVIAAAMVVVEAVRDVGNIFFHMDSLSKAAAYTVAASQTSEILSKHYSNHLSAGDATDANGVSDKWVAYADYSEEIYSYLLNMTVMRKLSEYYMQTKKGDKDSNGNTIDFYFNQPDSIGDTSRSNMNKCDSILDTYSNKLCLYYESLIA